MGKSLKQELESDGDALDVLKQELESDGDALDVSNQELESDGDALDVSNQELESKKETVKNFLQATEFHERHVKNTEVEVKPADEKSSKAYSRHIYFKLPLQQPQFHWTFLEKNKFFEGELKLIITTPEQTKREILVFKDGVLSENWRPISKAIYPNSVNFAFHSQKQYLVSEMDKVQIILKNKNDVKGIGADSKGILKAGTYISTSQFDIFHLEERTGKKDRFAFLVKDQWHTLWTMEKTSDKGWMANR